MRDPVSDWVDQERRRMRDEIRVPFWFKVWIAVCAVVGLSVVGFIVFVTLRLMAHHGVL